MKLPKLSSGRLIDFRTHQLIAPKQVWIRNDCDGAPTCVAELYVANGAKEIEVHLTEEECKLIRAALKKAIKEHHQS